MHHTLTKRESMPNSGTIELYKARPTLYAHIRCRGRLLYRTMIACVRLARWARQGTLRRKKRQPPKNSKIEKIEVAPHLLLLLCCLGTSHRRLQASTALLEEMRRQPFRCLLSGAAYFETWKRNGVGSPIERSRRNHVYFAATATDKNTCGESKE